MFGYGRGTGIDLNGDGITDIRVGGFGGGVRPDVGMMMPGMMGPGMMPGMMGPGMMPGMMGPGMYGGPMMGPGMYGGPMMY